MAAKLSSPAHKPYSENLRIGHTLLNKIAPAKSIRCLVEMLDDSYAEVDIENRSNGGVLFKEIINKLNLAEPDYFGLQFHRKSSSKPEWLERDKIIKRQMKGQVPPYKFRFDVRFFPTEPSRVAEDLTRYHMFLSLKKDLMNGRLSCPKETAAELSSLIVQSETGDYCPDFLPDQYISDYQLVPNQTPEFEQRVFHYHKENVGLSPAQAELKFLEIARRLELYGCDEQKAKDSDGYDIEIVVCSEGIKTYRESKRIDIFAWCKIQKVSFSRRIFNVHLLRDGDKDPDANLVVGFILPSLTSCKSLWKNTVAHHTFYRRDYRDRFRERPKLVRFGSTYKYRGRTQFQAVEAARRNFRKETTFIRTSSSRQSARSLGGESSISGSARLHRDTASDITSMSTTQGSYDVLNPSDSDSRSPASLSPVRRHGTEMNGILNDEGLLDISIQANKNGQFGLNFKGGAEQKLKPIITQIAPKSPASMCDPQLQEGDEIVYINGRKAEQLSHEQICCLIRSIGQSATNNTLTLSVRPFGSIENHEIENSGMQSSPSNGISSQVLTSMAEIKRGLENGDLLEFYVDMPKKKLELSTEIAHLPENKTKNRYRDILPYDFNRVVISGENDYINASHVQMDIGYSGMVNEYLAAQGPLSDTCSDFWQMIWDQDVSLVVMLTTTMENGKTKCHRYWPECGEHFEVGNFEISPLSSRDYSPTYIHRELTVTDLETDEERTIQHLQYTAWPDHGVPDDSQRFLTFVNEVRRFRSASSAPIVLHCSAGVGRTGVFIAVETACCLIEAGVPVYPEQMLDTLRDQRPSLIQTPGQFKFTCETFLDIYQDHFLKTQSMNGR